MKNNYVILYQYFSCILLEIPLIITDKRVCVCVCVCVNTGTLICRFVMPCSTLPSPSNITCEWRQCSLVTFMTNEFVEGVDHYSFKGTNT